MEQRPKLNKEISIKDFKDFYWLKTELSAFCKETGIRTSGSKLELASRIEAYLLTGDIPEVKVTKKVKLKAATTPITHETIIGTNYRTYKEKSEFFKSIIGNKFHFTRNLLEFFKDNAGKKTFGDAVEAWIDEQEQKKDPGFRKSIEPQFEYNTYIRDFLKDNPQRSRTEAIEFWKIKRSLRGDNKYQKSDLEK